MNVKYRPTKYMIADIITKHEPNPEFQNTEVTYIYEMIYRQRLSKSFGKTV